MSLSPLTISILMLIVVVVLAYLGEWAGGKLADYLNARDARKNDEP